MSCSLQAVATRSSSRVRKSEEEADRTARAAAAAATKLDSRKPGREILLVSLDDGNSKADFSEDSIDSGKYFKRNHTLDFIELSSAE